MILLIIGFLICFALVLFAKLVAENVFKSLSAEQRSILANAFITYRRYSSVTIIIFIGVFYLLAGFDPASMSSAFIVFFILIGLLMLGSAILIVMKLKKLELSKTQIQNMLIAHIMQSLGILILFAAVVITYFPGVLQSLF